MSRDELEEKLNDLLKNEHFESYRALQTAIRSFNSQLITSDINLFAGKDAKEFDRAKWYFENMLDLNKTLVELKKMMSPDEAKALENKDTSTIDSVREDYLKNLNGKQKRVRN